MSDVIQSHGSLFRNEISSLLDTVDRSCHPANSLLKSIAPVNGVVLANGRKEQPWQSQLKTRNQLTRQPDGR